MPLLEHNRRTERWMRKLINPFPNKPWFLHVCSRCLSKTLREKVGCIGFNATLTAEVITWQLVTICVSRLSHTCTNTTFFSKATDYFSHMLLQRLRGENTRERKVASTWDLTRNHQVMSPTCSPLSHPGGALREKEELLTTINFSFSHCVFYLFEEPSSISIKFEIVICKLFQFGRV